MTSAFFATIEKLIRTLRLGDAPGFDARKPVHRIAAILLLLCLPLALANAAHPQVAPQDAWAALQSQALAALVFVALALLGVGMPCWRDWRQGLERLGLRRMRPCDWRTGLAAGIGLYACAYAATALWRLAVPAEVFLSQTGAARQLPAAFDGALLPALLLALMTASSEEILFRGALQPVFGLLITALFFTFLHPQLLLTPGALIVFGAALGFGWLRLRLHTSVAMVAHASYNFLPFLLLRLSLA